MPDFDETLRGRRSVRAFLPEPVPMERILECLELAQHTPSNCNVQPWRVFLASGAARDRVRARLVEAVTSGVPGDGTDPIDDFQGDYRTKQVACAVEMYGHMGVARGDKEGRFRANLRNFELFDAPHVAFVAMEKSFGVGVALDVGMWVQTFMLALASRGIGSCAQASLRSYTGIVREELGMPESLRLLCGISFGYEDAAASVNRTRQPRDPVSANVVFRSE
ncbi:MAG: nitroreductase [Polyangiales bacterium]